LYLLIKTLNNNNLKTLKYNPYLLIRKVHQLKQNKLGKYSCFNKCVAIAKLSSVKTLNILIFIVLTAFWYFAKIVLRIFILQKEKY
jgi:hypothetical protein